jgi:glycerol-1-phosphatase
MSRRPWARRRDPLLPAGGPGTALVARYHGVICDLDGVVLRGATAVPAAIDALNRVHGSRRPVVFATNNASREPSAVAAHLRRLGLVEGPWSVVSSAEAAARHVAGLVPAGSQVLAVGGPGVAAALAGAGLVVVRAGESGAASVAAIVQGFGPDVTWRDLAEAAHLVREGVPWVATNLDAALPTERGLAPGNGALVGVVASVAGVTPVSTGKPAPAFFATARRRLGTSAERTLVCGDRLDTDVAGARAAGLDSLLVLSGVTALQALAFAPADQRPTYVAAHLGGLLHPAARLVPALPAAVRLADGVPDAAATTDRQRLLEWVVTTAWSAADCGAHLSTDPEPWQALGRQLALA